MESPSVGVVQRSVQRGMQSRALVVVGDHLDMAVATRDNSDLLRVPRLDAKAALKYG